MTEQTVKIKKNQKFTLPVEKGCVVVFTRTGANQFLVRTMTPLEMDVHKEAHKVAVEEKPPQKRRFGGK